MNIIIAISIGIGVYGLFALARRSDTSIGQRVRDSDWLAWRDAMDDAEARVEQLRKCEPPRYLKGPTNA